MTRLIPGRMLYNGPFGPQKHPLHLRDATERGLVWCGRTEVWAHIGPWVLQTPAPWHPFGVVCSACLSAFEAEKGRNLQMLQCFD